MITSDEGLRGRDGLTRYAEQALQAGLGNSNAISNEKDRPFALLPKADRVAARDAP
jgi:hypothetical protein